ncbi:MAG: MATE family efflux transporter [Ignavibacteria bacterium]
MNKKILRLAIPNIISNLSIPLLSSVDTAVVGHLDNVAYLGAIAIGSMIFNFVYWGFGFLRMGTTGLTAQANGSKNDEETIQVLSRSLGLALISAVFIILFQEMISLIAFNLVEATDEVEFFAKEYFYIRIYAAPASLALYAFHGWFLGVQNAKYPMVLSILTNVFNIFFNLLLIYQFGMKSDGVALGTVISQYLGLAVAVLLYLRKYSHYNVLISLKKTIDLESIKKFFKVNIDIFLRTLMLVFSFGFFTAESAKFGDNILAVNTILMQLWMILAYGVDGFAFAAEGLVGTYIGARDKESLRHAIKYSFYWGMALGGLLSLVYLLFGEQIFILFTDKEFLLELALPFLIWIIIAPIINSVCFIWDGVFIGATATKAMRNSMIICTFNLFLPTYYLTKDIFGNHSLWLAMTVFMVARGLTLTVYAKKHIFNKAG